MQGFLKKAELELAVQRRSSRQPLATAPIDEAIAGRYYQTRAIRRIAETFEAEHQRRALVVMATGAGKTRTVIALVDLLMRCNWVKRVLFLADRVALVNQAVKAFKKALPGVPPVNLVTEKDSDGRVCVSTYPTMMGLIEDMQNGGKSGQRRFGVGHFDLIVIDEAHRSVYQKYGAIFDYFDALVVGLTATPRDEIARDTYRLFNLERGVPTEAYALQDAVQDGYLVPAKAVSVPLRFAREGIRYAELSEAEKEQWDGIDWDEEDPTPPTEVNAEAVNRWLFNADTVDLVLQNLMTHGLKVAGGDRLGRARKVVYTDFEDAIGPGTQVLLTGITPVGTDFERFRAKARAFLHAHQDRLALQKLRRNQPLTATDLAELERLLQEAGASSTDIERARGVDASLGVFVRSLVGLDRAAAKGLFNEFLVAGNATASQIEFLNLVIDHLTEQGVMDAARLYESPFTGLSPTGPEGLFTTAQVDSIVGVLRHVRAQAAA